MVTWSATSACRQDDVHYGMGQMAYPDFGFARDSEVVSDFWVAQGTYDWINENRDILESINDISPEHAVELGHPRLFLYSEY